MGVAMSAAVSVIIITYNEKPEYLCRAIDSVLGQTYHSVELIVVDDGGVEKYSGVRGRYPGRCIKWISLNRNKGQGAARNEGIRYASADLIAFLDSDDWWEPEKLEQQVRMAASLESTFSILYCGAFIHPVNGDKYSVLPVVHNDWIESLLISQPVIGSASSVLTRKGALFEAGCFDESRDIPEDRDMWLKLAFIGEIYAVDKPLVHIQLGEERMSSDPVKKARTYLNFLEKYERELSERGLRRKAYQHYHASLAHKYFIRGARKEGLSQSMISIAYYPRLYVFVRVLAGVISGLFAVDYVSVIAILRRFHVGRI